MSQTYAESDTAPTNRICMVVMSPKRYPRYTQTVSHRVIASGMIKNRNGKRWFSSRARLTGHNEFVRENHSTLCIVSTKRDDLLILSRVVPAF